MIDHASDRRQRGLAMFALAALVAVLCVCYRTALWAQDAAEDEAGPVPAPVEAPLDAADGANLDAEVAASEQPVREKLEGINVFSLILKGGWFMVPIFFMSALVVTFVIERFLALRRDRVLPDVLIEELGRLAGPHGTFDPRQAYRLCQKYPSPAATVIRAMLLKVGRPHSEVEHAVAEASEREAERIYSNVRWLNLAAAVTPLLGLLGTVWGMIRAFHDTTQLAPGQNKADFLAEGIYVALVTTLGGLMVAIPAAIFSHYFEGRITRLFHEIDELLFNLMPQIERFEGRVRFSQRFADQQPPNAESTEPESQPAATGAAH